LGRAALHGSTVRWADPAPGLRAAAGCDLAPLVLDLGRGSPTSLYRLRYRRGHNARCEQSILGCLPCIVRMQRTARQHAGHPSFTVCDVAQMLREPTQPCPRKSTPRRAKSEPRLFSALKSRHQRPAAQSDDAGAHARHRRRSRRRPPPARTSCSADRPALADRRRGR